MERAIVRTRFRQALWIVAAVVCLQAGVADRTPAEASAPDWNDPGIRWRTYQDGMREIGQRGRPGVLVFFTEWCPHCKTYSRVFHDPEIVALSRSFVMIRVDRDEEDALNTLYAKGGAYVPRTLFLKKDRAVDWATRGSDPEYPHFLETENPAELKALMMAFLARS